MKGAKQEPSNRVAQNPSEALLEIRKKRKEKWKPLTASSIKGKTIEQIMETYKGYLEKYYTKNNGEPLEKETIKSKLRKTKWIFEYAEHHKLGTMNEMLKDPTLYEDICQFLKDSMAEDGGKPGAQNGERFKTFTRNTVSSSIVETNFFWKHLFGRKDITAKPPSKAMYLNRRTISFKEHQKLLEQIQFMPWSTFEREKNRFFIIFQWETGAREGSIEGKTSEHGREKYPRYCDIDEETGTFHLPHVKNHESSKNRNQDGLTATASERLIQAWQRYKPHLEKHPLFKDYEKLTPLFPFEYPYHFAGKTYISIGRDTINKVYEELSKAAEMEKVSCHDIRRGRSAELVRTAGVRHAAHILGDTEKIIREHYGHLENDYYKEGLDKTELKRIETGSLSIAELKMQLLSEYEKNNISRDQLLKRIDLLAEKKRKEDREGNWDPAIA
jgi:integrase